MREKVSRECRDAYGAAEKLLDMVDELLEDFES